MLEVACCEQKDDDNRDFHKTTMGLMMYELVSCDKCNTVAKANKCTKGFPLTTMGSVNCHNNTGLSVLTNLHGKLLTKEGLQKAADYFNSGLTIENDPPTAKDVAMFLNIMQGTHCRTVQDLNDFLKERNLPLRIPDGVPFTDAKRVMAYHYQKNCGVVLAAWEGSHRLYLEVALAQNVPLNGNLPLVSVYSIPKTDDKEWVYRSKKIPANSPILQDVIGLLLAPIAKVKPRDFIDATKKTGIEVTKAGKHVIGLNSSTAFLECVKTLNKSTFLPRQNKHYVQFLDKNAPFIISKWEGKNLYYNLRRKIFDNCWPVFLNDLYMSDKLRECANNKSKLVQRAQELATADSDGSRQQEDHYRLEALKEEIVETFYNPDVQRVHIIPEMEKADKKDYRGSCPVWLLAYLELLTHGCITTRAVPIFKTYFTGSSFTVTQRPEQGPKFMLTDEFLEAIVKTTNDVVSSLIPFYIRADSSHETYLDHLKNPTAKTKLRVMLTHNILLDIMSTVNVYGPNPEVPEDQYVGWAMR
jgi:hypothetical protein